jgi:DNA invertase Pin-like site-specific DNA recombinase
MSYENHQLYELQDGAIFLYTRDGGRMFHARVRVKGVRGYVIASTKKQNLSEAYAVARRWYDQVKVRSRQQAVMKLFNNSLSPAEIAKRLKISKGTVYRILSQQRALQSTRLTSV